MESIDQTLSIAVGSDPDGTPVIAFAGALDLTGTADAERAFAVLPASVNGAPADVVVDMTDLAFMDSAGLTVLLLALKQGHAIRLRRPTSIIRRLIAATGLTELLPVEP